MVIRIVILSLHKAPIKRKEDLNMKAVILNEHGGPDKLIYENVPDPIISGTERQ